MIAALSALIFGLPQTPVDPMRLPIGPKGEVQASLGVITATGTGKAATVDAIAAAADGKRFVFLGENHATAPHQQLEADVVAALVKRGRKVIVGLEMYTRPKQDWLDQWSSGSLSEADFLEKSDWKGQWGFPFEFYRPVFNVVKDNKLPLVALNVPRDWVRQVGRKGYAGLTNEARLQLPADLFLGNKEHKQVFDALMGGHPMTGPQGDNIYAAQVLWDEGMADTAIKWLERTPADNKTVFVVIAGVGHVMYGQGINYRVQRRTKQKGITVAMGQAAGPSMVSKGSGDFVYLTKAAE